MADDSDSESEYDAIQIPKIVRDEPQSQDVQNEAPVTQQIPAENPRVENDANERRYPLRDNREQPALYGDYDLSTDDDVNLTVDYC